MIPDTAVFSEINWPQAISFVPIGSKSIPAGQNLQFQVNTTNPDDDSLTFSASGQ